MIESRRNILRLALSGLTSLVPGVAFAQRRQQRQQRKGPGGGGQGGRGGGQGQGNNNDPTIAQDHKLIQSLFSGRKLIRREVKNLPNGVETLTETDNAMLRKILVAHVKAMKLRVEQGRGFHLRDPLFRELFRNAAKIRMEIKETKTGILVRETTTDPYVAGLIQRHAEVVSLFVKNGPAEARKNHATA